MELPFDVGPFQPSILHDSMISTLNYFVKKKQTNLPKITEVFVNDFSGNHEDFFNKPASFLLICYTFSIDKMSSGCHNIYFENDYSAPSNLDQQANLAHVIP